MIRNIILAWGVIVRRSWSLSCNKEMFFFSLYFDNNTSKTGKHFIYGRYSYITVKYSPSAINWWKHRNRSIEIAAKLKRILHFIMAFSSEIVVVVVVPAFYLINFAESIFVLFINLFAIMKFNAWLNFNQEPTD